MKHGGSYLVSIVASLAYLLIVVVIGYLGVKYLNNPFWGWLLAFAVALVGWSLISRLRKKPNSN